jgi:hypothetical protein
VLFVGFNETMTDAIFREKRSWSAIIEFGSHLRLSGP